MGSLNSDGSFINKDVKTYRNIGNFVHRTDPVSPNPKEAVTKDYSPGEPGNRADVTDSQTAILGSSSHIKITNSIDDATYDFVAVSGIVVASGSPELDRKSVTQTSVVHNGEKIVLRRETPGTLIERKDSEGAYD